MNKFTAVVIGVFFTLFPFLNYRYFLYSGSSTRSLVLVGMVAVLGLGYGLYLWRRQSELRLPRYPALILGGLYLIVLFLAGGLGLSFNLSFWSVATRTTGLWYFLNLSLFALLLWQAVSSRVETENRLIFTVIISAALYSVLGWLGPEGLGLIFKNYPGDGFTFGNSSFAGMYLLGAFLLSVYYLAQAEKKRWWLCLLPLLFIINPNFLNPSLWSGDFSQGIIGEAQASTVALWFSVVALVGIWLLAKIKARKTKVVISLGLFGGGIAMVIIATISLLSSAGFLHQQYLSRATAIRPLTWEIAEAAASERPWLGWGTDTFERVFERHYDNRVLQAEYGGEAWLDRAHNVTVDHLIDTGLVGLISYALAYLGVLASLLAALFWVRARRDRILAVILLVYFSAHLIELQTAFETSISYPLVAFMLVLTMGIWVRSRRDLGKPAEWSVPLAPKRFIATAIILACLWSLGWGVIPFARAQVANGRLRTVGSSEKRLGLYRQLLQSPIDQHAFLWRTSTDFQRGVAESPEILADSKTAESLKQELGIIEQAYRHYLTNNPTHFRAHLSLADVLIYERLFEVDKLAEAETILDQAVQLVPEAPQPYWMKAVGYLYQRKFDLARKWAKDGLALNPKIVDSQKMVQYIESSIKTFPDIELVFFQRI